MVLDSEGPCSSASRGPAKRGYVQIVENKRDGAAVRQRVIANIGRADELAASGALASLIASGAKLTDQVLLINALDEDAEGALSVAAKRIGGPLLFGRIWERLGDRRRADRLAGWSAHSSSRSSAPSSSPPCIVCSFRDPTATVRRG